MGWTGIQSVWIVACVQDTTHRQMEQEIIQKASSGGGGGWGGAGASVSWALDHLHKGGLKLPNNKLICPVITHWSMGLLCN